MNSSRIRLVKPVVLAALALAVLVPATGMAGSLSALTDRVNGFAKELQAEAANPASEQRIRQQMAKMPLYFIQNQGQMDSKVSHYLQGAGTSVYFTSEGLTYALNKATVGQPSRYALKLDFVGANQVAPTPLNKTEAKISYFQGSSDQWKTGVPTSAGLKYSNLWPGIDLVYSGTGQKLKYEFQVAPGADPSKIKLAYRGADSLSVNPKGQLNVATPQGALTDDKPFTFQEIDGKKSTITSSYAIQGPNNAHSYGFSVGDYDRTKPLVIDPALVYSGFIGGSLDDQGGDVAVDSTGAAYVTGTTTSTAATFPDAVGPDLIHNVGFDAFVAKVTPDGTGLVYAGYIGGSGEDRGFGIAVDSAGAAYVAGRTASTQATFPVLVGPDVTHNGANDLFVTKVNPAGSALVYSGYIGGSDNEASSTGTIAVDSAGAAYVGSDTYFSDSATFPVWVGPTLYKQSTNQAEGFVAKILPDGSGFAYCGYIGSGGEELVFGLAIDSAGAAYVVGSTNQGAVDRNGGFPIKVGPDLTYNGDSPDGFIAKIKPDGSGFVYAGYIGGVGSDEARAVAVDASGAAYVSGHVNGPGTSFPDGDGIGSLPTFDATENGAADAYVVKVKPDGTGLLYAGFVGGSGGEVARGISVDPSGAAYIYGSTPSTQTTFPDGDGFGVLPTFDGTSGGGTDGFIAKVTPSGTRLEYGGFIGGGGNEGVTAFDGSVVDPSGNVFVTGIAPTGSTEATFSVLGGPDLTHNGGNDAFITKISRAGDPNMVVADFNGNASTDVSVYRADTGTWYVQNGSPSTVQWGGDPSDKAVPGDYNGDLVTDFAVYRTSTGTWYIKDQPEVVFGGDPSDIPVPGDYNNDGKTDVAVYRKATGTWYVKDQFQANWGGDPTDIPVVGDYNNDGAADVAYYRRSTGTWYVLNQFQVTFGGDPTDVPVPGDYDRNGTTDVAVYRKATGAWYVKDQFQLSWGGDPADVPVPGDYDNNGTTDLAVYRKDTGYWYVKDQFQAQWGGDPSDKALPLPSAIREAT